MSHAVRRSFRPTITHSSREERHIRPESRLLHTMHLTRDPYARFTVVSGKNLRVPSQRIPAGIHVSINVDLRGRWKSALNVLSFEESVVWGDTVTL
jgi:hypothetical protein